MPVYEPDGTEIQPKGEEELEYLCTIGGEFDRTKAILYVYSEQLDKQEVSHILEVAPTKAWNPHEPRPIGKNGRIRVDNWGKWCIEQSSPGSAEQQIEELLSRCSSNLERWNLLTEKYDVWLTIVGYIENWNRELDLSPKLLKLLADRNLSLKVDVYFYGNKDDQENT